MTLQSLSPDDIKRMQTELRQDKRYSESRNMLLVVSLLCAFYLAAVGLMVMNDIMSMWVAVTGIGASVIIYFYYAFRFVKVRKTAEMQWIYRQTEKKATKKKDKSSQTK